MTPKDKAKQIYDKFYGIPLYIKTVKECCNITINEIIDAKNTDTYSTMDYWNEVKQEINKL
jgi:hypothetical protein